MNTPPRTLFQAVENDTPLSSLVLIDTPQGEDIQQPETIHSICAACDNDNIESLTRKLFLSRLNNNRSLSWYSRQQRILHPFQPLTGGYPMLFESLRLTTYAAPASVEAAKWSRDGFVMISVLEAKCVFCGLQLEFDVCVDIGNVHKEKSPQCPFKCHFDVGNITSELQRSILEKERSKYFFGIDNSCNSSNKYSIIHPEFEKSPDRSGTFSLWPKILKGIFPPSLMADAGFYYTGHNDMVCCFSCGVELFDWVPGVVPLTQHALASPSCFFLQQSKGQEFIDNAQTQELAVSVKPSQAQDAEAATSSTTQTTAATSSSSSPSQPSSPTGLRPYLDLDGIAAARARGYSTEQISDAIIKFLYRSSGYLPDSPLLLGLLKAGTDHHKTLCDKTQENLDKDKEIKVIKTEAETVKSENQVIKTENQVIKTEVQAKDQELQRQRLERQWRELAMKTELEQVIEGSRQVIEEKDQALEEKDQALEEKDQALEEKDQALEENRWVIHSKDLQLSILQQEVEELRQRQRPRSAPVDMWEDQPEDPEVRESQNSSRNGDINLESCLICADAPMQVLLRPCKHLSCCALCVSKLDGRCPICRRFTTDMEKVYVS